MPAALASDLGLGATQGGEDAAPPGVHERPLGLPQYAMDGQRVTPGKTQVTSTRVPGQPLGELDGEEVVCGLRPPPDAQSSLAAAEMRVLEVEGVGVLSGVRDQHNVQP